MSLPLQLYRVKSRKARKEYFVGIPAGDTDMATAGVVVLTSNRSPEVIVARLTADEYADYEGGPTSCAQRINAELNRDDLQPVELDFSSKSIFPESLHFVQNFGLSHPFHDIHDPKDLADVVCAISIEEFESQGGTVRDLRQTTNA